MTSSSNTKERLSTNVLSGGLVNFSRVALQIFVTPIIIFYLGSEQYGLVAFAVTVQSFLFLLDYAVSPVIIREFGALDDSEEARKRCWSLFLTFERVSILIGFISGAMLIILAPAVAKNWIKSNTLTADFITLCVRLIGLNLILQWPSLFYSSCFVGLQRQFSLAKFVVTIMYIQSGVTLVAIKYFEGNVLTVLSIQSLFSAVNLLINRVRLHRALPYTKEKPGVDFSRLYELKKFASGTFFIGLTIAVLTQVDKIFISKFAKLDAFSAYSIAFSSISQISVIVTGPLMASVQPLFANIVNRPEKGALATEYHKISQINSIVIFSFILPIAFFSETLFKLWLGVQSPVIETVLSLAPLIVVGSVINAINSMPYTIQIAAKWTSLKLSMNVVQVVLFVALLYFMFPKYGLIVGPILWIGLNALNTFIEAPIVHKAYLSGEYFKWLFFDVIYPAGVSCVIYFVTSYLIEDIISLWLRLAMIIISVLMTTVVLIAIMPEGKSVVLSATSNIFRKLKFH